MYKFFISMYSYKTLLVLFLCAIQFQVAFGRKLPYKNPKLPIEQRVEDLLERMTLKEKVYQLCALRLGEGDEIFQSSGDYSIDFIRQEFGNHGVGHISCPTTDMDAKKSLKTANEIQRVAIEETRLGIPTIINDEALHGCKGYGSTSFPQSIALSCTWNLDLMAEIGNAIGKETYDRGVRQVLSPTLDLAREPRHGRMEETYGEDAYLVSRFGVEYIKGLQKNGVICTPKHFLANFVGDGGRDAGHIALSERELREIHMVPYQAAVMEGGARSIMAAYNAINGVPCSSNYWLLTDVLRNEWGFKGFVVSDWSGVNHTSGYHKIAPTLGEAAIACSKAGMDVDLPRIKSYQKLIDMVEQGKIKESSIDDNVRRVLYVKFESGLFEHPYVDEDNNRYNKSQHRELSKKAARESIVLLKNKHDILPLHTAKKIAVIGPNANTMQLGGYSAEGVDGVTPLEGIKNHLGDKAQIMYSEGCSLTGMDKSGFQQAIQIAEKADLSILVMGGRDKVTGGEHYDRADLDLMGVQEDLILEIARLGKPFIVVLIDGRPVTMSQWLDKADAVIMMFYAGEEGGNALGEIISGKVNPSGKLTVTFPVRTGDLPMCLYHRPYGREGNVIEQDKLPSNRYYYQFPFGYGLSYTSYKYSNFKLAKQSVEPNQNINFSIDITNTGKMDGDEIVQVYLTDLYCRVTQSEKILKTFKRVHIPAGETKTISFSLPYSNLSFLNEELKPEVESGEFELFVGTDSQKGIAKRFSID